MAHNGYKRRGSIGGALIVIAVGVRYTGPVIRRAFRAWREHWEARAGAHLIDMIRKGKGGI